MFDFGVFTKLSDSLTPPEIAELNRINKNFSRELKALDKDIYLKEIERFVIELSWKSSKIEGNTYSLLDTEALIKQRVEAQGHPKEEMIMILNHKMAFESILAERKNYKTLTFAKVAQIHNFLVKSLSVSTGLRKQAVGITGTAYRPLGNQWQIQEAIWDQYKFALNTYFK